MSEYNLNYIVDFNDFTKDIIYYKEIDSTNNIAKKILNKVNLIRNNFLVLADTQINGRGKGNSHYFSPPKVGIYMSAALINPQCDLKFISVATSLAVYGAVKSFVNADIKIKWPNDILINGKKVCGILTEGILSKTQKNKINPAIIGIGINLQEDKNGFPEELSKIATSANINFEKKDEVINFLLQEILLDLKNENHNLVMDEYKNRSNLIGKVVNVIENTFTGETYQAKVIDITDKGHLLVKKKLQNSFEEKITEIFTGEVSIKF